MRFEVRLISLILAGAVAFSATQVMAATSTPTAIASATPTATSTPAATSTATPTPTATAPARKVAKYNVAKPFFQQSAFSKAFDEHMFSYKKADSVWVLVNKVRPLDPQDYKPRVVRPPFERLNISNPSGQKLRTDAASAMAAMDKALFAETGLRIKFASGYRSYDTQKIVHAAQVARLGKVKGENLAAREGFSEHQTGLSADISTTGTKCYILVCFGQEVGGKWLAKNSWRFGFILRYPNGKTPITGYQYEPWHFRYIGELLAEEYHYLGATTLEHFLGAGLAPAYDGPVSDADFFY